MTLPSEKVLISNRRISGLMSNLNKKTWTDSIIPTGSSLKKAQVLDILALPNKNYYHRDQDSSFDFPTILLLLSQPSYNKYMNVAGT